MTRNGIILSKEIRNWKFLKTHILLTIKEFIKTLLYEDQRWKKMKFTIKGLKDGIAGRLGECDGV